MPTGVYKRKPFTKQHIINIGKSSKKKIYTKQWRENLSKSMFKRWKNPEYRKMMLESSKYKHIGATGYKWSLSQRKKQSETRLKLISQGFFVGANNPNWNGGSSFEPYPIKWTRIFKEQMRHRDKHQCQICGVPEIECNKKLHVHHIDYNKKNISESNLISLCNSCHGKTNQNRKDWEKFFKNRRLCVNIYK